MEPTTQLETAAVVRSPFGLNEAISLGLATLAAYIAAYEYESAISTHFGISLFFIRISTEVLLTSFFSVAFVGWTTLFYCHQALILFHGIQRGKTGFWSRLAALHVFLPMLYFLVKVLFGGIEAKTLLYCAAVVLGLDILVASIVGLTFLVRKYRKPRAIKPINPRPATEKFDLINFMIRLMRLEYLYAILALLVVSFLASLAGVRFSRTETRFQEILSKKAVIVRNYGDLYFCKTIAPDESSLSAETFILTNAELVGESIKMRMFKKPPQVLKQ